MAATTYAKKKRKHFTLAGTGRLLYPGPSVVEDVYDEASEFAIYMAIKYKPGRAANGKLSLAKRKFPEP